MIAGLVLAAGAGSRLGQPKAPLVIDGERLVDRAVRILREGGCDEVLVVLGAWRGAVPGARVVLNDDWETGMGSSLRAGLDAVLSVDDCSAVVVTLVDLPQMTAAAVRAVLEAPGDLVVGTFHGESGHPIKLARGHWAAISADLGGDVGARAYLRGRGDLVRIELGHLGDNSDLDTQEDLRALGSSSEGETFGEATQTNLS